MSKSEEKYAYEIHMQRIRDQVNLVRNNFNEIKNGVRELNLKMDAMERLVDSLEEEEITVEIIPIKKPERKNIFTRWVKKMKK